jgi:hypothetical protein
LKVCVSPRLVCLVLFFVSIYGQCWPQLTQPSSAPTPATTPELAIDQIKKAVVFLSGSYLTTSIRATKSARAISGKRSKEPALRGIAGTGFFIYAVDPRLGRDRGITYLVTNKHMIREPNSAGLLGAGPYFKTLDVRVNTVQINADGTQFAHLTVNVVDASGSLMWFTNNTDNTIDLALTPIHLDASFEYKTIPTEMFATKELFAKEHVNENDEVLFAGLFAWNPGAKKNYPIVRHGKLARLSEERIPLDRSNPLITTEVHLADVMSFGGNSGSPVFLREGGIREGSPTMTGGYSYYLLGIMQGFFPEGMDVAVDVARLKGEASQNSGIAAVIPADKILDLLESPRAQAFRERIVAASYEQKKNFLEADRSYRKAIELMEVACPGHSDLASAFEEYARFLYGRKRDFEALAVEEKSKRIRSSVNTDLMKPRM